MRRRRKCKGSQADPAQARPCRSSPMSFRERDRISHRIHYCRAAKAGTGSTAADKAIGHGSHSTVTICA
ncbi:Secondary metabolism regulator LAE1 [Fusarium oxysporum f. sp. albedinis]|nr:Secondary metabolism regulator LAE1 [Fusarium oxysporum f. sp. albedinis]